MQSRNPFENLSKSNKILLLCVQIFDRNYWRWSGFLKIKGKYSSKTHIPMHIARSLNRSNSFASVDVWFCVWMPLDSCWVNYFYIFTIFPSWFVTPFWWGTCIEMSTYVFTLSKSARGKKNRKKEKRKRQKKNSTRETINYIAKARRNIKIYSLYLLVIQRRKKKKQHNNHPNEQSKTIIITNEQRSHTFIHSQFTSKLRILESTNEHICEWDIMWNVRIALFEERDVWQTERDTKITNKNTNELLWSKHYFQ